MGRLGPACWCGGEVGERVGREYAKCRDCGTLVSLSAEPPEALYGARYWQQYVPEVLEQPRIEERARTDLSGRAAYYLRRILDYVEPGARVLEIGCAPGGLAFLMSRAGFSVCGLELGDFTVEFVRDHFGIDVRPGPVEEADVEGTFDAIVMIDVLEHLPHPAETLDACIGKLDDHGVIIIQTPCYRDEGSDWPMLQPIEHTYLYTEESVARLLSQVGLVVYETDRSLFHHDMWIVAASLPLTKRRESLAGVDPLAVAMIDWCNQLEDARRERDAIDEDRTAKDAVIERLSGELEAVREDQRAKEALIREISAELEAVRADQRAKQALIEKTSAELEAVREDQRAKETLIGEISTELAEVRADQQAKEELIRELSRQDA